jgi:hypothetical protein
MKFVSGALTAIAICLSFAAHAGEGYEIKGRSGVMVFVAVDSSEAENEDVYRFAVADACAGKPICQVHYWVGSAPTSFPLSGCPGKFKGCALATESEHRSAALVG